MSTSNFLFNNLSNIGNDKCDMTNRNLQNIQSSNYTLENYSSYNPLNSTIDLATTQPNVFFQGSIDGGINRDNIDTDSKLRNPTFTKSRERVSEQKRIFNTIPYLGKGVHNVDTESDLINKNLNSNRKTSDPNVEVSHIDYAYYPLIPSLESTISNPANLVEGAAAPGWIRGGVPSRILNRDAK